MARPKKDNIDYFSHDNDMRNDAKIKIVINKFGLPGYAIWCMLLECLCKHFGLFLLISDAEIELLAYDMYTTKEELMPMIEFFVKIGLIQRDKEKVWCEKLNTRLSAVLDKREKNQEYYNDRKESTKEKNNNIKTKTKGNSQKLSVSSGNSKNKIAKPKLLPHQGKYSSDFERFWLAYPIKKGKAEGYIAWQKAIKETIPETIISSANIYAKEREGKEAKYTKWSQGWLNSKRWEDEETPIDIKEEFVNLTPKKFAEKYGNDKRSEMNDKFLLGQ